MVVGVDEVTDVVAGVFDGFGFGAPSLVLLDLSEPGLDEGLGLGVSIAASAVADPES